MFTTWKLWSTRKKAMLKTQSCLNFFNLICYPGGIMMGCYLQSTDSDAHLSNPTDKDYVGLGLAHK